MQENHEELTTVCIWAKTSEYEAGMLTSPVPEHNVMTTWGGGA
jgi:hypothetical protein